MRERRDDYAFLYRDFRWVVPERFNIGVAAADRWAAEDPNRTALFDYRADGAPGRLSYLELARQSNAFANALFASSALGSLASAIDALASIMIVASNPLIRRCAGI